MEEKASNTTAINYLLSQFLKGNLSEIKIKLTGNKITIIESVELVEKGKVNIGMLLNEHSHQVINVKTSGFNQLYIERIYKRKF